MKGLTQNLKVLLYHRIVADDSQNRGSEICLPQSTFRRHLEYLDRLGFTTITFEDYNLCMKGELNFPKKPIILSFDDGYADTFEQAFPLIQEFGMRGVVFVLGDRTIRVNWWDRDLAVPTPLLQDHQILELHEAGWEIGSHALTHKPLLHLSKEEMWEEVSRSRMNLEIMLNRPVVSFAYPFGQVTPVIKQIVKDGGYIFGCAAWTGPRFIEEDPLEVRRVTVNERIGLPGFLFQVLGPYTTYRWLIWKLIQSKKVV